MNLVEERQHWQEVESILSEALGMHYDECHKIYLAMDQEQVDKFLEYGYTYFEPDLELLKSWFEQSCWLKFVSAVYTNHQDPNAGYVDLIPQFAFEEDENEFI